MHIKEASSILGVSTDASEDEINKAYKQKSFEYHPDRYKKDNGEMFRKVAEAKKTLLNPEPEPIPDFTNPFTNFRYNVTYNVQYDSIFDSFMDTSKNDINLKVRVTFEEFVKGAAKKISYKRKIISDGVLAKTPTENISLVLKIPPFTTKKLLIKEKGNMSQDMRGRVRTSDVYVEVILDDDVFTIQDRLLLVSVYVTLHEAVHGETIEYDLFYDYVKVKIPELSKNGDTVTITTSNPAAKAVFDKIKFVLNVQYPDNIKEII